MSSDPPIGWCVMERSSEQHEQIGRVYASLKTAIRLCALLKKRGQDVFVCSVQKVSE